MPTASMKRCRKVMIRAGARKPEVLLSEGQLER